MQLAKTIIIKSNMNCNLRCKYCYEFNRNGSTYSSTLFDINQLCCFIERMARVFPDSKILWMLHGGEPLINGLDYFNKFIECIRKVNDEYNVEFKIALQTNATLLTDEWIVRQIFQLYSDGWGYKKIANHLTDLHIPTSRMAEKVRREENGEECKISAKNEWSIVTVSEILRNDFYIGTLRQGKYRRKKINGGDMKLQETDHLVFENNHTAIIDYRVFAQVK